MLYVSTFFFWAQDVIVEMMSDYKQRFSEKVPATITITTTITIVLALSFLIVTVLQDAAAQAIAPQVNIETFRLPPGESQTRELTISLGGGITEATVTQVAFQDGDLSEWLSVEKEVPFTAGSPEGSGADVLIDIPITASVPSSYEGTGGQVSALVDLDYQQDGRSNTHAIVQEFSISVEDRPPELWPLFGIGAVIAAAGALYGVYLRKKRRNQT